MDIACLRVQLVYACVSVKTIGGRFAEGYNTTIGGRKQQKQVLLGAQFPAQGQAAPEVTAFQTNQKRLIGGIDADER
jgi:hypothetical protein